MCLVGKRGRWWVEEEEVMMRSCEFWTRTGHLLWKIQDKKNRCAILHADCKTGATQSWRLKGAFLLMDCAPWKLQRLYGAPMGYTITADSDEAEGRVLNWRVESGWPLSHCTVYIEYWLMSLDLFVVFFQWFCVIPTKLTIWKMAPLATIYNSPYEAPRVKGVTIYYPP